MDILIFSITICIIYLVLWFFDSFFKSCMHYPYDAFLRGTGLTVKLFRLQWYTTALNRTIVKWSNKCPRLLKSSYDIGVLVSISLLPVAFIFYIMSMFFIGRSGGEKEVTKEASADVSIGFEVLLPGINLPLEEIGYYICTLTVCSVFHELGHALAAVLEDVPITGFGFYIFLVFPIAYTEMGTEQVNALRIWAKLKVLCAGIWHNVALSLVAYAVYTCLSVLFMPLYSINTAVLVTNIQAHSRLLGAKGLANGDVVTSINDCEVRNLDSWYDCLLNTIREPPAYCISSDFVLNHDESVPVYHSNEGITECCDKDNFNNLCFEYLEEVLYSVLELPQFMCLNVRNTIEHSAGYCHHTHRRRSDLDKSIDGQRSIACKDNFCIKPQMNNATTILQIKRHQKADVIYIGHPADLSQTIKISEYVPKTSVFSSEFADVISTFLKYVVVFSFGMAVLNVFPCFGLDGHHIVASVVNHMLGSIVPERRKRDLVVFLITSAGSLLFLLGILKVLWTSVSRLLY